MGTQGYGIDLHNEWYHQTISHNTITIDGYQQPPATGILNLYKKTPRYSVIDASTNFNEAKDSISAIYRGVNMRRTIAWCQPYFLDCFFISCPNIKRIDLFFHVQGKLTTMQGVSNQRPTALPTQSGWKHITPSVSGIAAEEVNAQWTVDKTRLYLKLPYENDTTITTGTSPSNPAEKRLSTLIRTRFIKQTVFITLIVPGSNFSNFSTFLSKKGPRSYNLQIKSNTQCDIWDLNFNSSAKELILLKN